MWNISIDTGGTFTDCMARDPAGGVHRVKVLSSGALRGRLERRLDDRRLAVRQRWGAAEGLLEGFAFRWLDRDHEPVPVARFDAAASVIELAAAAPEAPGPAAAFELAGDLEAPVLAAHLVTGSSSATGLPPMEMRLATTRGTNALLERRGADVALFVTAGFGDLLLIGDQQRPDLFSLSIRRPAPLYRAVVEVSQRLAADGSEVGPFTLDAARAEARRLRAGGLRSAAVALMHSYLNPEHERRMAGMLQEVGFEHVSCSSDLSPMIKLLPRTETAVTNAYLATLVESYFGAIRAGLAGGRLHVMTSAGGLVGAEDARAKDCLLSGPAGGVTGAATAGRRSGFTHIVGFDMGGTSTDVSRYGGDYEYLFEHVVGGARLAAPALAIETVAAGGGSICEFADGALRVGPRSASADPGPACYGAGGPLTLTDVNLLLGRLDPDRFGIPIDVERAGAALDAVLEAIRRDTGAAPDRLDVLQDFLGIANQRMSDAIAEVSLSRGYDPKDHCMVAFGGAGGQHACAVADHLGIETIVMPADASLLSAVGLGGAVVERFAHQQVLGPLEEVRDQLGRWVEALAARAAGEVAAEGVDRSDVVIRRRMINLRLQGQATSVEVELSDRLESDFARRYQAMYGHQPEGKPIEVESVRVVASSRPGREAAGDAPAAGASPSDPSGTFRAHFGADWIDVPVYDRGQLPAGAAVRGPALVFDSHSAYVIEPDWAGTVDGAAAIVLRRLGAAGSGAVGRTEPARRQLFTNRFMSVARQMGRMLQRTALSTNVKERLDFSCALLDADGELVVHAPHMPVHLGALGLCVRAVRGAVAMEAGDVVVTNHPAHGGSHLPDVTVVTPVHHDGTLLGYVASRAHHAEIGGTRPGSMPPLATSLGQEGVVILPRHLVKAGVSRFDRLAEVLTGASHPTRALADNLADLRAAVAANRHGAVALEAMALEHGARAVGGQMAALKGRAEKLARGALAALPDGCYQACQRLDDGSPIRVRIDLRGDRAVIDFDGTAGTHPGNLNATPAVVRSAVIYVLRVMIGESLPLNEGIMQAVDVRIPRGMLNPDFPDDPDLAPAVGGGNVETSQRIVDTLLEALGLCACSQGTMNNVLFGTDRFSYYETICGGSGAGPGFDGSDAVHTHMTNTRITDPEILEQRYPVRLERFAIRRGSGGRGRHRGGDGAERRIRFLEPMSVSILSQHRTEGPYGMEGGQPGAPGKQHIERAEGSITALAPIDAAEVNPGDVLVMETPGGGAWGGEAKRDETR